MLFMEHNCSNHACGEAGVCNEKELFMKHNNCNKCVGEGIFKMDQVTFFFFFFKCSVKNGVMRTDSARILFVSPHTNTKEIKTTHELKQILNLLVRWKHTHTQHQKQKVMHTRLCRLYVVVVQYYRN
mmetsp:Transcript_4974/g.7259  ORF Transcript_4974/g.7259 Transcript_4974/m.7259 type:complete len:127 (-) Transcript_4974:691-1071(-)